MLRSPFTLLFFSAEKHPLLLQFKEACPSGLEPYAGKSMYENHGQRVVVGQRLTQSSSDIFLGWFHGRQGYDLFGRRIRDMKLSIPLEGVSANQLPRYAELYGRTLARTHAKSGGTGPPWRGTVRVKTPDLRRRFRNSP